MDIDKTPSLRATAFDNAARSLGNALTRRDAIVAALTGLASVVASQLGIKTAWAATCLCGGTIYDPALQCCFGAIVVPKNPVRDAGLCPNRVQRPNRPCRPNGCGGTGGTAVPNRYGAADFGSCCNSHDCCYATCGSNRAACDNAFEVCLQNACVNSGAFVIPSLINACFGAARLYAQGARRLGERFFAAGQAVNCDCCGPQTCLDFSCGVPSTCTVPVLCVSGCNCARTTEGFTACVVNVNCADTVPCSSTASCGAGRVCVLSNCCGTSGFCAPVCGNTGIFNAQGSASSSQGPSLFLH